MDLVGGEFAIKRRLGSEIGHDSNAAKRNDQAQQEQVMLRRYVALEWCRREYPGKALRMAGCAVYSTAEDDDPMAACRVAPVLAMAVLILTSR
jgi:hypothetical protein